MKTIMNSMLIALTLVATLSCGSNEPNGGGNADGGYKHEVSDVIALKSGNLLDISTDKAVYLPGEAVKFTAEGVPAGAKVRYRHGADVIAEADAPVSGTWSWNPPATDFTGYMVDIYQPADKEETILATIAVDVSSDWTRFPRYGFVGDYGADKLPDGVIEGEMDYLKRCHINGIQFYDWHNKHHWPLGGTRNAPDAVYKDIANKDVYTSVVKKYIDVQHKYGMKAMFYNLCFGALDDAYADGVMEQWNAYRNPDRSNRDMHGLPNNWKSDIYVLDPGNAAWQKYIADRNDDVYYNFDFDGYHIDQLGYRGDLYDYNGNAINLPKGYGSFIAAMKARHPQKRLVMNSVASYGASQIVSGAVDFCYNEVWNDEDQFANLHSIIKANDLYSKHTKPTVFAAYMNYDKEKTTGGPYFNTPGVLLTDAVIMAIGGAHLELGDHMLCSEYFPSQAITMSPELKEAVIRYYDFMTAYQNLLRGGTTADEFTPQLAVNGSSINLKAWPPKEHTVVTYGRNAGDKQVVSLLNFRTVEDLCWRDLQGTRKAPIETKDLAMTLTTDKKVQKLWVASPDYHGGAPQQIAFRQEGNKVDFVLPALKYWTMLVIE